MAIATGVAKSLRFKKETTWNTAAGASSAQLLRRVTSDINLTKQSYQSQEIRDDYQIADFRHGPRSVTGTINGELSPGTYQQFFAAAMRQAWQTAATTGALANVTATTSAPHFVRAAGSFITDGFKVGDVVRWSGWATTGAGNNARNYRITALTATDMTVRDIGATTSTVGAKASGDSVTCAVVGKKVFTPETGHTDDSFSIEHWHSDISQSHLFTGCKISTVGLNLPATGMATAAFGVLGADMTTDTSAYFTSPTAATGTGVFAAVNGSIRVNGSDIAILTGLSVNINGGYTSGQVIGSNITPDIFEGRVMVNGQFSAYFQDGALRDNFLNEDEISLFMYMTTSNAANADFLSICIPRLKVGSANYNDGEQGLMGTYDYQALLNTSGGAATTSDKSTLIIQDSTIS